MGMSEFVFCLAVMAGTTYLVRLLPLLLVRREIKSRFLLSFLHYVPYAVLSAMTFPSVFYCTGSVYSAIAAVVVCIAMSLVDMSMIYVAIGGAATVAVTELIIKYL